MNYPSYFKEYQEYFKKGKINIKITEIEDVITLIQDEYRSLVKDKSKYRFEKIKLKDEINRRSNVDKAFNISLMFLVGFVVTKVFEFINLDKFLNPSVKLCIYLIFGTLAFVYILFQLIKPKHAESFYYLCLNILDDMYNEINEEPSHNSSVNINNEANKENAQQSGRNLQTLHKKKGKQVS